MDKDLDALEIAKYFAEKADATQKQGDSVGLAIAFMLIALCEELEEVVDYDSQSLRVSAWNMPT